MRLGNTIKFAHMTLGLVPEVLDAIDVVMLVRKQFGVIDTKVLELTHIKHIISTPAIRVDDTVRYYLTLNDREQCR